MFYPYVYDRGDLSSEAERRSRQLKALIEAVRDRDELLCYEQRNETAYTFRQHARPQSTSDGLIAGSRLIR